MDNNILACEYGIGQLFNLIGSGYCITLNQRMVTRLVTADIEDAAARVEALKGYKAINLYAQAERNERHGITPNAAQLTQF